MTDSCLLICVHECLQYRHYPHMIIVTTNRFIYLVFFLIRVRCVCLFSLFFIFVDEFIQQFTYKYTIWMFRWILRCDLLSGRQIHLKFSRIERYWRWPRALNTADRPIAVKHFYEPNCRLDVSCCHYEKVVILRELILFNISINFPKSIRILVII